METTTAGRRRRRHQFEKENDNGATTTKEQMTQHDKKKHQKSTVTIDDILNDSAGYTGQQNRQSVFSLPDVGAPTTHVAKQHPSTTGLDPSRDMTLSCSNSIMIHGIEEPRGVISALKSLSQRDVMDALQFSSTQRLFQQYSGDENTCIAKALVGATSLYAFPLSDMGEHQEQQKKTTMCEALCSAYDACRSKVFTFDDQDDPTCFEVYVYADAYTAVFQQSEKDGMVAMVSRSTPGMKRLLDLYGIAHEVCGKTGVVFRGEQSAHGLFDILLNNTISSIKRIVAPVPFQNASLLKTPFRISCSRADVIVSTEKTSSIPPWVVSRLKYLLLLCSGPSYTISTKSNYKK